MKKLLISISIVLILQVLVFGQDKITIKPDIKLSTDRGHFLVSPNSGISASQDIGSGSSDLNLALNLDEGYFIFKNFAITLITGFEYSKAGNVATGSETYVTSKKYVNGKLVYTYGTRATTGTLETTSFLYGGGFRYYLGGKIFVGANYLSEIVKDIDPISSINAHIGYAAFLNRNVAIEPAISYLKGIGDNSLNRVMFKIGFGIYL